MAAGIGGPGVLTGERVGGYTLGDFINSGNFGQVYAVTVCPDDRDPASVAVKMIHAANAKLAERASREIAAMQSLAGHPHVLEIFDYGTITEGKLSSWIWIAMERADQTLHELCFDGASFRRLSDRTAASVARAIVRVLRTAHEKGIFHRDLKPDNVFLVGGVVKIGDFGLAAQVATDTGYYYLDHGWAGAKAYMAPELFVTDKVGPQSDIYAMGMTMHWLLTGTYANPRRNGEKDHDFAQRMERTSKAEVAGTLPAQWRPFVHRACRPRPPRSGLTELRALVPAEETTRNEAEPQPPPKQSSQPPPKRSSWPKSKPKLSPAPQPKPSPAAKPKSRPRARVVERAVNVAALVVVGVLGALAVSAVDSAWRPRLLVVCIAVITFFSFALTSSWTAGAKRWRFAAVPVPAALTLFGVCSLLFSAGLIFNQSSTLQWLADRGIPSIPPAELGSLVAWRDAQPGDCLVGDTFKYRVPCERPHTIEVMTVSADTRTSEERSGDADDDLCSSANVPSGLAAYGVVGTHVIVDGKVLCMVEAPRSFTGRLIS